MARWEGLGRVPDLVRVASAHIFDRIHDVSKSHSAAHRNHRLAHGKKMRPQAADGLFDDNLKEGAGNQGECESKNAIRSVAEAPKPILSNENNDDRDDDADECLCEGVEDGLPIRVGELCPDNVARVLEEGDWKESVVLVLCAPDLQLDQSCLC